MILLYAFAAMLTAAAAVMTTIQTVLTLLFRRRGRFFGRGPRAECRSAGSFPRDAFSRRRVSILKPVCGVDDDLEGNLEPRAAAPGVGPADIVSIAGPAELPWPIVERIARRQGCELALGGDPARDRGNPRVALLIAEA